MNEVKKFTELEIVKESHPSPKTPEYVEANVPYFCKHRATDDSYCGYGRVIKAPEGYTLIDIGLNKEDDRAYTTVQTDISLKVLVDRWNIKRLRGKIILYEGEE